MKANDIKNRLSRLEKAIHSGLGQYCITCSADVESITSGGGIIFLNAGTDYSRVLEQVEKRITDIGATGKYTIIIDNIPNSKNEGK